MRRQIALRICAAKRGDLPPSVAQELGGERTLDRGGAIGESPCVEGGLGMRAARGTGWFSWGVLVWLLAACGAASPRLPGQGGAAWLEIKSAHFTLWTDASA